MSGDVDRGGLGARIRESREYRGFSQEQVATKLGISRSAVSLIESGTRRLEAIELATLARLFECTLEELTGSSPSPARAPESVQLIARAAAALAPEDRAEVLRFAEYLRSRKGEKRP